jgi:hypothetical protein
MKLSKAHALPLDNRPLIKDLLAKHSTVIEGVRNNIQNNDVCRELYNKGKNSKRYDDIWILRFVLSHKGKVQSASKAALKTIKFREEKKLNELGDIRHRLRGLGVTNGENAFEPLPGVELYDKFCSDGTTCYSFPDNDRGIMFYVDLGKVDMHGVAKTMSDEEMTEFLLYANEAVSQVLDDVTRRTGRLTKQLKVIDLDNVSLRKVNLTYIKRDATGTKALEDYYPQLLGNLYIFNSPSWFNTVWNALSHFFPKRFVEKVDVLPPLSKIQKSRETHLKTIMKYVSVDHLPEKFGGLNKEWPLPWDGHQFVPRTI